MSEDGQISSNANVLKRITAAEVKSKFQDKPETYHFCTHELGLYLPPFDTVTVWHLRDLITCKRTKVKGKDVHYFNVPQYDGLGIKEFIEYAVEHPEALEALPSEKSEILKMPRQYIINIINTMVGSPFRFWVNRVVNQRHEKVKVKNNLDIEMDEETYNIFKKSQAVSTGKGTSYNMLKPTAKRRRTTKQIEEQKKMEIIQKTQIDAKVAQYDAMKQQVSQLQQRLTTQVNLESEVQHLIDSGLMKLDEQGTVHHVETFEEHQNLQQQIRQDQQIAQQLQHEQQNQPQFSIDASRQKPGQQLEFVEQSSFLSQNSGDSLMFKPDKTEINRMEDEARDNNEGEF